MRCTVYASLLGAALLCAVSPGRADRVDDYVRSELDRQRVPGVAVAVIQNGKVVKAAGYGFANLEHRVPVKPETVFQSGSLGKQFTAAVAMLLVEDGKIKLDDPVKKFLVDAPPAWDAITIRHLLTHTSGIPDYGAEFDFQKNYTDEERLRIVYAMKLEFPPGARFNYSNTGYLTLGVLLSRAGGEFYGDILTKRVFMPLSMTTARIINELDVIPDRAAGYWLKNDEIKNQEWVSPTNNTTADGSLYFTVLDVAKWANAARTKALLKPESWREMTTPVQLTSGKTYPYGFGWFTDEWNGKPILEHGGAWQGFTSQLSRRIGDDELAVVVLTNRAGGRPWTIARGIMAIYEPDLAEREPPVDPEPKVTAQLREFCIRAATGKVSESEFAFFRGGWKPERVEQLMKQLARFGEIKSLRFLERRELGDDVAYRYNATTEKEPDAYVGIQFTKDGKISAFTIQRK